VASILNLINPVDVSSACSFILNELLRLQIGLVSSDFPPKILYASPFSNVRVTYLDLYYDKGYQQMPLSFVIFLYYTSLPYMFRASISPSSGVSPAVAYLLPLGSCSA